MLDYACITQDLVQQLPEKKNKKKTLGTQLRGPAARYNPPRFFFIFKSFLFGYFFIISFFFSLAHA